jgi:hypothetical protein
MVYKWGGRLNGFDDMIQQRLGGSDDLRRGGNYFHWNRQRQDLFWGNRTGIDHTESKKTQK